MSKQQIHAWIDDTTYLYIKANVKNISGLINQLLNAYAENEQIEIPEEVEILKQIEESKKLISENKDKLSQLSVMLAKVRADAIEQEKIDEELRAEKFSLVRQLFREQEMEQIRKEANRR